MSDDKKGILFKDLKPGDLFLWGSDQVPGVDDIVGRKEASGGWTRLSPHPEDKDITHHTSYGFNRDYSPVTRLDTKKEALQKDFDE